MDKLVDALISDFEDIKRDIFNVLNESIIEVRHNSPYSDIVSISPNRWGKSTDERCLLQIKAKESYLRWIEIFKLFTRSFPGELLSQINSVDTTIRNWVDQKNDFADWDIPSSILDAKNYLEKEMDIFCRSLDLLLKLGDSGVIIIPDTNSAINIPDPTGFRKIVDVDKFEVVYLPTVLSELDALKMRTGKSQELAEKAKSLINRLKGYRTQGDTRIGVTIDKSITVKMIAVEPNFDYSLSWLDSNNNDDRIIASVLEVQIDNPSKIVCLISSDINLQNKAEMARIPYSDIE